MAAATGRLWVFSMICLLLLASGPPASSSGTPLRGLFTAGRSPHAPKQLFSVGPTGQFERYTASRPFHCWPVPPRPKTIIQRRAHRPVRAVRRFAAFSPLAGPPTPQNYDEIYL